MWFEGEASPNVFPSVLAGIMATVNPADGLPFWSMVSSNIGSALTDDGWVFHSRGSSGNENLFVGFNNALQNPASWFQGHRFFVADSYTAGAAGVNGLFGERLFESHRYANDATHAITSSVVKYYISLNKDRVIVCTRNFFTQAPVTRTMTYMGLLKRYLPEQNSSAVVIANTNPTVNAVANSVRVLRNRAGVTGLAYTNAASAITDSATVRSWGNRVIVFNLAVGGADGMRGDLEGVLCARFVATGALGATAHDEIYTTVGGREYLVFTKRGDAPLLIDNFASASGVSTTYLIEKV